MICCKASVTLTDYRGQRLHFVSESEFTVAKKKQQKRWRHVHFTTILCEPKSVLLRAEGCEVNINLECKCFLPTNVSHLIYLKGLRIRAVLRVFRGQNELVPRLPSSYIETFKNALIIREDKTKEIQV